MARVRVERVSKQFRSSGFLSSRPNVREEEDLREDKLTPAGGVKALDDVSLEIADGETVCLVGPSGCGKTTLLRVISGLETPDTGRVYYDDQDVTEIPPKDRGIGIVFQNYALYPHMDSKHNLGFFFRLRKREHEIDERVRITAEILGVGFEQLLDRRPKALSGGQQQRVAIGRCIIRDPRLFLFDEPLSNLDAQLRARTRVEVKRLLQRFKITTVYVTHDQVEAIALADRIAVMRHGRIEQLGTYWDLYDKPINQFVASFIGMPPMNFLSAIAEAGELRFVHGALPLPPALGNVTGPVTVGIRPEHVQLARPSSDGFARGVVDVVEPLPSERIQIVHLRLGDSNAEPAHHTFRVAAPLEPAVQAGDEFTLTVAPERIHLFDQSTEANLQLVG